jgi:hypothetical protein
VDAYSTAAVLIEWFAAFDVAQQWVSDQVSHFKNKLMSVFLSTDPHSICNYQGTDGTIINKQVHSMCSPLYRARNSVVYNSITALEL